MFPPKKLFSKNEKVASERRSKLEVNIFSSFRKDIKVNLGTITLTLKAPRKKCI